MSTRIHILGLAAISTFLFLFKLGKGALLDWDEAIHAEVSKEIVSNHRWMTLYWQHAPYFKKPPFSFWVRAELFQWFGVTEFWARFESALAGVAIVLLTYGIARRLSGSTAGLFAALVLLTSNHFDRVVREGTTDAALGLCIFLALYAYLRLREARALWFYVPLWFYMLCAAVGIGAMIKGPAILVVPLAIGVDWLFTRDRRCAIAWREWLFGGLLFLAIVAPWHLWMVLHYGRTFVDSYFGYQLAARATQVLEGSGGGPFFYLRILLEGAFPWSLVVIGAAARRLWRKEWKGAITWAFMGVLLVGYSLIPTKHPWYIFPIYPALAIEVGRFLAEIGENRRLVRYASVVVLALGLVAAFVRLALRQGDPFTNEVATMATMAKGLPDDQPLLIVTRSNSQLDTPTATFYSDRRTTLLEMPFGGNKIAASLKDGRPVDAIIENAALDEVSQQYQVHTIAESESLTYASLSARH